MAPYLRRTQLARSICCACHACCTKSITQTVPKTSSPPSPPHRRTRPRVPSNACRIAVLTEQTAPSRDCRRPAATATRLLVHSILRDFHPGLVVLYAEDANALSGDAAQAVAAMRPMQGRPTLYLCENFTCRAPVTTPEDACRLLERAPERSWD